ESAGIIPPSVIVCPPLGPWVGPEPPALPDRGERPLPLPAAMLTSCSVSDVHTYLTQLEVDYP
ncbi:MAG: hypothetical protein LC733_09545, partial [Actinobacteria bacterium]|nr:hypothetical protein [Actinomycetota bacterium]